MYLSTKGLGSMELKTYFSLLKLNSKISEKRKNIEKIRIYSDVQIIKKFSDEFLYQIVFFVCQKINYLKNLKFYFYAFYR